MTMRDVMSFSPSIIGSEQRLSLARTIIIERGIGHLPVLRDGTLIGVLCSRDVRFLECIPASEDAEIHRFLDVRMAASELYVVSPDEEVSDVARVMVEQSYTTAIVVGRNHHILGIFTITDALRLIAERTELVER